MTRKRRRSFIRPPRSGSVKEEAELYPAAQERLGSEVEAVLRRLTG
jgi:hypothetical protein